MNIKLEIQKQLEKIVNEMSGSEQEVLVEPTENEQFGDYSTNIALILSRQLGKNPREIADDIVSKYEIRNPKSETISKLQIDGPGFINFFLSNDTLIENLQTVLEQKESFGTSEVNSGKKIMVEYAHPNTHKEMHIGHMRTLITGEAIARILEVSGAEVFRANYQGDIGMHVAKAMLGIKKMIANPSTGSGSIEEIDKKSNTEKAHFLGQAYALGSSLYEENKEEVDQINNTLYSSLKAILVSEERTHPESSFSIDSGLSQNDEKWEEQLISLYKITRQWSLYYYEEFYKQFYTKFDRLFFESEMADPGLKIVKEHIGDIFTEDNGAVIFRGEDYGLHTRVFVTQKGTPTYEAKDMANAYKQYEAFPFDKNIHVVASEQAGYFQVVFKALELLDPEKFKDSELHLSMGMVQLKDRKMSSRTGDVFTVDSLIDDVRVSVKELTTESKIDVENQDEVNETISIGAIKYSVLKVGVGQDALFDIKSSVSLEGNSGPYLQYTFARTQSVLSRGKGQGERGKNLSTSPLTLHALPLLNQEERSLLRALIYFPEVVEMAAVNIQPNLIANYLYDLAQKFNLFYQKHKIISPVIASTFDELSVNSAKQSQSEVEILRLRLTQAVGQTLNNGLSLLGIHTVEKM